MAVALRTPTSEYRVVETAQIIDEARSWIQTLRSRGSWSRLPSLRHDLAQKSLETLQKLCPELENDAQFSQLASAGLVEVRYSAGQSKAQFSSFGIPWEFLLSAATERKRNRSKPLLVSRHLASEGHDNSTFAEPSSLLVLKNNPAFLGDLYADVTFHREEKNVSAHLQLSQLNSLHNEPLPVIKAHIEQNRPAVIHVAGIDVEQAANFNSTICATSDEALMVDDSYAGVKAASAQDLADTICAASDKPVLVSLNFVNSGSQIAPAIIDRGAGAVLAFLNDFDDIVAETFFANFYLGWRLSRWNLLDAFRLAWSQIPSSSSPERLWGTGIVLWSRESLLDREKPRLSSRKNSSPAAPIDNLRRDFNSERERQIPDEEESNITIGVKPYSEINYSLLHNNRSMFQYFFVRKPQCVGRLSNLRIDVTLGDETLPYRTKAELKDAIWMLEDEVRIPLTSRSARSAHESIYTALFVSVSWKDRKIMEKTFRVNLLPIDQWQDDAANRKWLPSFVLPRDPAISTIIDAGQRYLLAISDNAEAAFDGYQGSMDTEPTGTEVMKQVIAIWWSLVSEQQVNYTVSPPTYSAAAQRLRSPASILKAHRGTCIDFALLMAACLENVGIYATIFLLRGHALVGFYRDKSAHKKVCDWVALNATRDSDAWVLGIEFFPKLSQLLQTGELVPIETTYFAKRRGLSRAIEEGANRLKNRENFEYFFDIKLARDSGVTPLPLLDFD